MLEELEKTTTSTTATTTSTTATTTTTTGSKTSATATTTDSTTTLESSFSNNFVINDKNDFFDLEPIGEDDPIWSKTENSATCSTEAPLVQKSNENYSGLCQKYF